MRCGIRVLRHIVFVPALALMLSASSCTFNRQSGPPVPSAGEAQEMPLWCAPQDCYSMALLHLRSSDYMTARLRLTELADRYPDTVWAARASFLLAGFAIEEGSSEALGLLDDARTLTDIGDYLLLYRARAYSAIDLPDDSVKAYEALELLYPDSPLNAEARFEMGSVLMSAGYYERSRSVFASFVKERSGSARIPDALLNIAISSVVIGDNSRAATAANTILLSYPASRQAGYAKALVSELKRVGGVPEFTAEERLKRAERLFAYARYKDAIAEYSYLAANVTGRIRRRSMLRLAVCEARLKRYGRAEPALNAYLKLKDPENEVEALYWLALTAARQGKEDLLGSSVRRMAAKYPKSRERARSMLLLANLYDARGLKAKSAAVLGRVAAEFKGTEAADEAIWRTGWRAYRAGRYTEAARVFSSREAGSSGGAKKSQFLYWTARSLEKTGRRKEAAEAYNRVCASEPSYYCQTSLYRLEIIAGGSATVRSAFSNTAPFEAVAEVPSVEAPENDDAYGERPRGQLNDVAVDAELPADVAQEPESDLSLDPRYLAARELLILGLDNYASKELSGLMKKYPDDPAAILDLADLFYQAEDYYRAMRIYYRYLSKIDPKERSAAAAELREYSFPPGLVDSVRLKAPEGVDPYLVAAVMREESSYNPGAVSVTGALGLMQIMPATGRFVARELGRADFEPRELLNPETNIRMGSWYLGYLYKRFDQDLVLTIAGYNAGPGAARRWRDTLPTDFDEFIESIPYAETRRYAKKVLKSYAEFRRTAASAETKAAPRPGVLLGKEAKEPGA